MHITTLRAQQTVHFYASKGSRLHLSTGQVTVSESRDLEGLRFDVALPLQDGGIYTVPRSGWLLLTACRSSELLYEAPPAEQLALIRLGAAWLSRLRMQWRRLSRKILSS